MSPGLARALAFIGPSNRKVALHNLHTGEELSVTYFEDGQYVPDALDQVNQVLRDFRTGDVHQIEPGLLDLLHVMRSKMALDRPLQVISGYRSPKTNAYLASISHGVARHSLHMEGMAIDIRAPGIGLAEVHRLALSLGAGGVGYYPASDFVHVDVGPVRHWGAEDHWEDG